MLRFAGRLKFVCLAVLGLFATNLLRGDHFRVVLHHNKSEEGFGFIVIREVFGKYSTLMGKFLERESLLRLLKYPKTVKWSMGLDDCVEFDLGGRLFFIGWDRHLTIWSDDATDRFSILNTTEEAFVLDCKGFNGVVSHAGNIERIDLPNPYEDFSDERLFDETREETPDLNEAFIKDAGKDEKALRRRRNNCWQCSIF